MTTVLSSLATPAGPANTSVLSAQVLSPVQKGGARVWVARKQSSASRGQSRHAGSEGSWP